MSDKLLAEWFWTDRWMGLERVPAPDGGSRALP